LESSDAAYANSPDLKLIVLLSGRRYSEEAFRDALLGLAFYWRVPLIQLDARPTITPPSGDY
jgi:hypothetical protein